MLAIAIAALLLVSGGVACAQGDEPQNNEESRQITSAADEVMSPIEDGLTSQNPARFLSAFDAEQMPDYENFAGQIRAFFRIYDNFRIHYQILQTQSSSDKSADVIANVQLEGDDAHEMGPGVNRSGQLHIRIVRGSRGWKIVELSPREFFR
jgi:hypothetical protein